MQGFNGFPAKGRMVKIPGLFFSDLVPQIDSLAELKVTLYCFWRLQLKEGDVLFLQRSEIEQDAAFMGGLASREKQRLEVLEDGLERAVSRGTLLRAYSRDGKPSEDFYFFNTERGRKAVESIGKGEWYPEQGLEHLKLDLTIERPNVFRLYEQNIGPLTPLIAENLTDLEKSYPLDWIQDAIEVAVNNNARKLSYMMAVLKRWQEQGRSRSDDASKSGEWYISGKYSDEIEY
jgi:DNA replication protein